MSCFSYVGADFPKLLENPLVEYRQANLTKEGEIPPRYHKFFNPS